MQELISCHFSQGCPHVEATVLVSMICLPGMGREGASGVVGSHPALPTPIDLFSSCLTYCFHGAQATISCPYVPSLWNVLLKIHQY